MSGSRVFAVGIWVLGVAACAGCVSTSGGRADSPVLETATATYLAGEYDEAVRMYTDFLATSPPASLEAEGYLGRGNAYYRLARFELAEADFRASERAARDRNIRAQATLGLAHSLFAQDRYGEAERLYLQMLRSYKGSVPLDEATYRLGMTLVRQGKWDDGQHYLDDVVASWPTGEFAKLAKAKIPSVQERTFSVQIGAFTNRTLADGEAAKLKAKGFPGEVVAIDMDGVRGFAVRSGRFATWGEAGDHASRLDGAGFPTYRLP